MHRAVQTSLQSNLRAVSSPPEETLSPLAVILVSPWLLQPKTTIKLLSVSVDLPVLDVQYKRSVTQLCLTLCHTLNCSLPGSSVHGIFQARMLEWVTTSSSRGSSRPGIKPMSPVSGALQADSLLLSHRGSPLCKQNHPVGGFLCLLL